MEDHFNGLPGFKSHYLYDDFSTPCFDGRHTMMQVCNLTCIKYASIPLHIYPFVLYMYPFAFFMHPFVLYIHPFVLYMYPFVSYMYPFAV